MQIYIALLRGINVGGNKKILMADLRVMMEQLTFQNVTTYIQSGNIVFTSAKKNTTDKIALMIEKAILETFGFDVHVMVLTLDELANVVTSNPFYNKPNVLQDKLHVSFLSDVPNSDLLQKIGVLDFSPDEYVITNQAFYLYCPQGYGNTKLSNPFIESKLKVKATTRNWKTTLALLELSRSLSV